MVAFVCHVWEVAGLSDRDLHSNFIPEWLSLSQELSQILPRLSGKEGKSNAGHTCQILQLGEYDIPTRSS